MSDRVFCFLNQERQCDATCISFRTIPEEGGQHLDDAQKSCVLLASIERTGRSLNIIGSLINKIDVRLQKQHEDAKRTAQPVPPSPFGTRS